MLCLSFTGHLSLFCLSANHLNRLEFFLDSKLSLLPHLQKWRKLYYIKRKKQIKRKKYILINNQRWKIATHVRHKASWTWRSLIPPSAIFPHDRRLSKCVTLHFYQKMVQSSLTRDGQWPDVMETSCVSYYTTVMMGKFAGTYTKMCSV